MCLVRLAVGGIGPRTNHDRHLRSFGFNGRVGNGVVVGCKMSRLVADCHDTGQMLFAKLAGLHDNSPDIYVARISFLAMLRIRILEQRIEELHAEIARLEAANRVGY